MIFNENVDKSNSNAIVQDNAFENVICNMRANVQSLIG